MSEQQSDAVVPTKRRSILQNYRDGGWSDEFRFTVALVLVGRRWRAMMDERLRPFGQSAARMEALSAIMVSPEPSSQVSIANRLRIEGPTMTRMIDSLSRDGLVERRAVANDRRTKHLVLTEAGVAALEQTLEITEDLRTRLLSGFDKEEQKRVHAALRQMLVLLDSGLPPPEEEG